MSGHSHFKTVKATKDANDAKRGKIFSKLARIITMAVKEGGKDPLINARLKTAIEQTKKFNMPKENVERAIQKGTGELAGENLEEISIEVFGPMGTTIILEGITDNKNRTLGEVRGTLSQYGGKVASEGAVKWMFSHLGYIAVITENKSKEELELAAIESGAEDVVWSSELLEVYTKPEDLEKVRQALEAKQLKIDSSSLVWRPKEEVSFSGDGQQKIQKLFDALDENDAIQDIYSNLRF